MLDPKKLWETLKNFGYPKKKDVDTEHARMTHKGSNLFKTEDSIQKAGYEERYDQLLKEN